MTYDVSIFLWGRKLRFPSIAAMNPCTDRPVESARIHQIRSGHDGDHVGSLPLEIMLQIAEHMDPADIVRSQRVSKRWRTIFSCEPVIKCALHKALAILGLDSEAVAARDARAYFRWLHGLQCGQPVAKFFLHREELVGERRGSTCMYDSRRLCCGSHASNEVVLFYLETRHKTTFVGAEFDDVEDAEDAFWSFYLSNRYVVLICDARGRSLWTVYDIQTQQRQGCREFPGSPETILMEKDKLAWLSSTSESSSQTYTNYIWDLSADRVGIIDNIGEVWLWHMDTDRNLLVTFEIDWEKHPAEVQQTEWTLRGRPFNRKRFALPLSGHYPGQLDETKFIPETDCLNHTFAHKTVARLVSKVEENVMMDLVYDCPINKLSARWIDHDLPPKASYNLLHCCDLLTPYISYQWNASLGQLHICNTANNTSRMRPYQWECREIQGGEKEPFGDQEVLCLFSPDGVQIWCFNPNFIPSLLKDNSVEERS